MKYLMMIIGTIGFISWFGFLATGEPILKTFVGVGFGLCYGFLMGFYLIK